jgi:ABC-type uncharacterized transport system substrate-binding protein
MRRREFNILLGTVLVRPRLASAQPQPTTKVPRIGYLMERSGPGLFDEAFLQGLRELGYVEGRNIAIEYRWAEGNAERLPALAAELVTLKVDAIVTAGTPAVKAAKEATTTIPLGGEWVGPGMPDDISRSQLRRTAGMCFDFGTNHYAETTCTSAAAPG